MLLIYDVVNNKWSEHHQAYYDELVMWDFERKCQHSLYAYPTHRGKPIGNYKRWKKYVEVVNQGNYIVVDELDIKWIGNKRHNPSQTWVNADWKPQVDEVVTTLEEKDSWREAMARTEEY